MEFDQRLQRAIERGKRAADARARAEAEEALNEQELRQLHTSYRLQLSEHIEHCLKRLPDHFPGFQLKSVVSDRGWGAAVSRDDSDFASPGARKNYFSRLEMTIRPINKYFVLELVGKGTIRNKEVFNRTHYERLAEVDLSSFMDLIDFWTLEFAELYAAKR
jgi:hypothetical protein